MTKKDERTFFQMLRNTLRISKISFGESKIFYLLTLFFTILITSFPFINAGIFAKVLDQLVALSGGKIFTQSLIFLTAFYLLFSILTPIAFRLRGYFLRRQWFLLEEKFEMDLIRKRGELDIATREDPKENNLIQKVSEGGVWRCQSFNERVFFVMANAIGVIIASVVLIIFNKWIFLSILLAAIPGLIVEIKYGKKVWTIHNSKAEIKRRFWNLRYHFHDISNAVELKTFQNTNFFSKSIRKLFRNFLSEEKKNENKKFKLVFFTQLLAQGTIAVSLLWFIGEVVNGAITIGALSFAVASIGSLKNSLTELFSRVGSQYEDSLFVTDYFEFLDKKDVVKKPLKGFVLDKKETPEIIFDNVSFHYPDTKKEILKDFSLTIKSGEKVALVGINGAGKTTLIKLLCRFYDPTRGRILVGGKDLKTIDLESWYNQLGILFQDYAHYHFLVKESIAIGKIDKKTQIEEIKKAAKAGEADMFIEEWENSYDQVLGKQFSGGVEPSIGQWQKLALARIFYRDPRILVLDEPTSSIDAEAEANIFGRIETMSKDRTVILTSHRFSTVRRANKIVVIENGKIIEEGSHEELMKLKGQYARLFNLQAEKYQ